MAERRARLGLVFELALGVVGVFSLIAMGAGVPALVAAVVAAGACVWSVRRAHAVGAGHAPPAVSTVSEPDGEG